VRLDALLSTIILVTFVVTILMAVASYAAYKVRERRRPNANDTRAPTDENESYFERVLADPPPPGKDA
jgi:heme/copper-type cytochrome/quinol oxidase subunit 2